MLAVDFQENFWGEKLAGYDILYQNFKCGSNSGRELAEFIKTRSTLEEYNYNLLIKLARKTTSQQLGTFQPLWQVLKSSTEKVTSLHMQTLPRLQHLVKEINKYCEDHYKRQKQIKNEENATIEAMNELKEVIVSLTKAKEFYYSKVIEVDRLKKEGNASPKDIEKAEARLGKACTEYKVLIEKYNKVKDDYEKKFCISCKNFQRLEEDHLKQMKDYLATYSYILESGHALVGQVYKEFQRNCHDMTIDVLMDKFIKARGTGNARLKDIQFEEWNASKISSLPSLSTQWNTTSSSGSSTLQANSKTLSSSGGSLKEHTSSSDLMDLMNQPNMNRMSTLHRSNNSLAETSAAYSAELSIFQMPSTTTTTTNNNNNGQQLQTSSSNITQAILNRSNNPSSTLRRQNASAVSGVMSSTTTTTTSKASKWFSRHRKDKTGKSGKKSKSKASDDDSMGSRTDLPEMLNNGTTTTTTNNKATSSSSGNSSYYIDEEGFTVRPKDSGEKEVDDFYSSSDDDDDEDEEKEKKIFVKINPLNGANNMSTSVDQLIASAGALTLAPSGQSRRNLSTNPSPTTILGGDSSSSSNIKRSVSANQQQAFKPAAGDSNDLFSLFNQNKTTAASVSTLATSTFNKLTDAAAPVDRYAALSELFSSAPTTTTTIAENEVTNFCSAEATTTNVPPLPPKSLTGEATTTTTTTAPPPPFPMQSNLLSKSLSTTSTLPGGSNAFSVYKPLSKSFAAPGAINGGGGGNFTMPRTDSLSSLSSDFRMTPISYPSSRDSSPLTIGMSDTVPIAIAFQESVGTSFKGADEKLCKTQIVGCFKIAFSVGIIQVFSTNPHIAQLSFKIKNTKRLDRVIMQKEYLTQVETSDDYNVYEMNMTALQAYLRRQFELSPHSRYYNLDLLKYQVKPNAGDKEAAPLHLVSHWKCEPNATNLKIDYKFNPAAFVGFTGQALKAVLFTANIDGAVLNMHSQPEGRWDPNTNQATWRFNEISQFVENSGLGSIKAKLDLSNGPTHPSSVYVQFSGQDTIFSGLDFELVGSGYRTSLIKKQFSSGRYYCEPKL